MFSKPLSIILVYLVTLCNLVVLSAPLFLLLLPFVHVEGSILAIDSGAFAKFKLAFLLLIFAVSFLMLFFLFLDMLFGFSVRSSLKNCIPYEKIKDYDFLTDLFDQVKNKFGVRNVRLYIKKSDEVNAFAVSSFHKRRVVLTKGLINHYLDNCKDSREFLYALRSIIGHEMSHLVNKDFLPTFLIITNQKATNIVSNIIFVIFNVLIRFGSRFTLGSSIYVRSLEYLYVMVNYVLTLFNRLIVYNVYELLRKFISRSIEYRCDNQSAKAFGGKNMALALSMLGDNGYFTLFSTHPGTLRRIKKVKNVKIKGSIVRPRFFDSLANYFSIMILLIICLYFAKLANIDYYVRILLQNHAEIRGFISSIWHFIIQYF